VAGRAGEIPKYRSGNVDLLLVVDNMLPGGGNTPLSNDELDAAFSAEDNQVDVTDPLTFTWASL
jgi:hypothetical protein